MNKKLAHALPVSLLLLPASWVLAQTEVKSPPPAGQAAPVNGQAATATTQTPATGGAAPAAGTKGTQDATKPPLTKGVNPGQVKAGTKAIQGGIPGMMPGMPAPQKPAWKQFKLNPKTTIFLDFTEANADAIISIFSRTSGITILKDPSFKVPLTVISAKPVKLDEAFEIFNTVLGLNGYELQKVGNLMLVARKQPPQPPQPQAAPPPPPQPIVKTYFIQNAAAAQVAKVITDIYGPAAAAGGGGGGGQPQFGNVVRFGGEQPQFGGGGVPGGGAGNPNWKISSDEYSNSVTVKAMPAEQTKIEELIKELDKSTATPLVNELFKLKFIPADQAVAAIEDLLTANTPTGRAAGKSAQPQYQDYYYYGRGGGQQNQHSAGGQSATAIKQTNSVNVNATKSNMELIRQLLTNMDQPAVFADNTTIIKLQNAKATDVADLLNKAYTQQRNNNGDNGFVFFSDYYDQGSSNSNKKNQSTDFGENGEIVNIHDITGNVTIQADPNTNSIVIVTQPSNLRMIRKVIEKLDVAADQVIIETVIVEANLTKETKLGVEYNFVGNLFGGDGFGSQSFGLQTATSTTPNQGLQYTLSGHDYKVFLNAIQTDARFKVLDTPRIYASNNIKAEINVSQRVPYSNGQAITAAGAVSTGVTFLDVGVVLTVTPRVTANGQVTMDVVQTADDLVGFQNFDNQTAPLTNQRKATTTVSALDGQTVVLGGIIQHTERQNNNKVPILGDVPLLGNLFRSTDVTKGQTELMVFLTPHIVHNNADAQKIRQDTTNELTGASKDTVKKVIPPK